MLLQRLIRKILCHYSVGVASTLFSSNTTKREVLLTFDDGPHPEWTPELLDLLKESNIKGIFFVVGENVLKYPSIVERISNDGHILANHTFGHYDVNQIDKSEYYEGYLQCEKVIDGFICDVRKSYFRPPRGLLGFSELCFFIKRNIPILLWTADSNDSDNCSAAQIVGKLSKLSRKQEILLFHDDSALVVEVLKKLIPIWKSEKVNLVNLENINEKSK